jgi:hypothetical protein
MQFAAISLLGNFKFVDRVFELHESWEGWIMCHEAPYAGIIQW